MIDLLHQFYSFVGCLNLPRVFTVLRTILEVWEKIPLHILITQFIFISKLWKYLVLLS